MTSSSTGKLQPLRGARDQKLPRLRRGLAQRHGRDLDGFAGDRRALIGDQRGIAEHDDDARKGHVEFFGDDLPERGANAGAEIDMAVIGGDRSVGGDPDEGLELDGLDGRGGTNDGQRALRPVAIVGRGRCCHQAVRLDDMAGSPHRRAHDFDMRAAAAQMMAQRFQHLGFGRMRACAAAAPWSLMIMPLRQ